MTFSNKFAINVNKKSWLIFAVPVQLYYREVYNLGVPVSIIVLCVCIHAC
jgi:hypothetical protein